MEFVLSVINTQTAGANSKLDKSSGQRHIPQGSAVSSLVVEMLLAPVCISLPACGQWIVYADNFLALARTGEDVVAMTLALRSALGAHPAGPLGSKEPNISENGAGIEFLGHHLRRVGKEIQIEASTKNIDKFLRVARYKLARLKNPKLSLKARLKHAKKIRAWAKGWAHAFKHCPIVKINAEKTVKYTYHLY